MVRSSRVVPRASADGRVAAWTFGAGDPNSGTASVHEIVKGFGALLEQGWKPLRTIVLASWDAEEYGLIGSTEVRLSFAARGRLLMRSAVRRRFQRVAQG